MNSMRNKKYWFNFLMIGLGLLAFGLVMPEVAVHAGT